jgi:DivIVA domain-containing protein
VDGSIDRIRNARFSHAVRGYDRYEVDQFLSELADWLESGGGDAAAAERVRDELERVGEQVAGILTEAHDAAAGIRDGASSEVRQSLVNANVTAESLRSQADEYAEDTREEADAYARKVRAEADEYAEEVRGRADADAEEARASAQGEAGRIVADANERKHDMEAVISDLADRRDAVLAELERLASGIAGTATRHRDHDRADAESEAQERGQAAEQPSSADDRA